MKNTVKTYANSKSLSYTGLNCWNENGKITTITTTDNHHDYRILYLFSFPWFSLSLSAFHQRVLIYKSSNENTNIPWNHSQTQNRWRWNEYLSILVFRFLFCVCDGFYRNANLRTPFKVTDKDIFFSVFSIFIIFFWRKENPDEIYIFIIQDERREIEKKQIHTRDI